MDNIHVVKETTLTVGKKPLVLVLPYSGSISLRTRTKLMRSFKNIFNCTKYTGVKYYLFSVRPKINKNVFLKKKHTIKVFMVFFFNFS